MSETPKSSGTLAGFQRVGGSDVLVYKPDNHSSSPDPQHPRIILLLGWMNAQIPHLQKYTDFYKTLYPDASIILARSWSSFFVSGTKARQAVLSPVVDGLEECGAFKTPAPPILVHTFSNGGAYLLTELSRTIQARHPGFSAPDTPSTLIFDSCPGFGDIGDALEAFTASIKPVFVKYLMYIPLALMLYTLVLVRTLKGKGHLLEEIRTDLQNPSLLPWTSKTTPRLYLYSDSDKMVRHTAVDEHVAQGKQLGYTVEAEFFKGSPHVSHARKYPERYWDAITSSWAKARQGSA